MDIYFDVHKWQIWLKEGECLKGVGFARRDNIGLNVQSFWDDELVCSFEVVLMSFDMSNMEFLGKDIK